MFIITCKICKKKFSSTRRHNHGCQRKYCSRQCMAKDPERSERCRVLGKKTSLKGYRFKTRPGFTINKSGYKLMYKPEHKMSSKQGYVMEHRLIMENYLGRLLEKQEKVHHINGNPSDNRIENLRLYTSQQDHMATHRDPVSGKFSPNLI